MQICSKINCHYAYRTTNWVCLLHHISFKRKEEVRAASIADVRIGLESVMDQEICESSYKEPIHFGINELKKAF